jgi:hypothetical protein
MALHILIFKRRIRSFGYEGTHSLFVRLISKYGELLFSNDKLLAEFAQARRDIPQFAL